MKAIFFKVDLRLNPQDEHAVIAETFLPYSEENVVFAIEHSVDGQYHIEEIPEPVTPADEDVSWDTMAEAIAEGVNEV